MNETHVLQMLGNLDDRRTYLLPKDIAEILIRMPKTPVVSENEIDVGINTAFLKSNCGIEFYLEDSTLSLVERAYEMGGLIAYTYLTPLTEITLDYFENLDPQLDLTPLKERKRQRREKYNLVLAEHERLARAAMKRLAPPDIGEFKRFIRLGKPDFYCSQLQLLELRGGESAAITRWETACNNKTTAALLSETPVELYIPQITTVKKPSGGASKKFDFRTLLAALLKATPKKPVTRLEPSEKVTELLTTEAEIQEDFEPSLASEENQSQSEPELQQLVKNLLETREVKKTAKPSLAGKRQDQQSQRAPASSSPELER